MSVSDTDTEVVKPLTHAERRAIIEAPLLCRVIGSYRWSGTSTNNWLRDNRDRAYTYSEWGEWQWLKTSAPDTFGG
jgi:hypothetical protein